MTQNAERSTTVGRVVDFLRDRRVNPLASECFTHMLGFIDGYDRLTPGAKSGPLTEALVIAEFSRFKSEQSLKVHRQTGGASVADYGLVDVIAAGDDQLRIKREAVDERPRPQLDAEVAQYESVIGWLGRASEISLENASVEQ